MVASLQEKQQLLELPTQNEPNQVTPTDYQRQAEKFQCTTRADINYSIVIGQYLITTSSKDKVDNWSEARLQMDIKEGSYLCPLHVGSRMKKDDNNSIDIFQDLAFLAGYMFLKNVNINMKM